MILVLLPSLIIAIKVNTVLTNLDLSRNNIGDSGAASLSNAMKINTVSEFWSHPDWSFRARPSHVQG